MERLPALGIYYSIAVDGVEVIPETLCESWVKQFVQLLEIQMGNITLNMTWVSGSGNIAAHANNFASANSIDVSTQGVVIGTGTTAVTATDSKLATQITTGSGSGQLRYLAGTYNTLTTDSTGSQFQIVRPFINNSGASITVNEIGIYCLAGSGGAPVCMVRDVLGSGVAVGAGQTITVTYTLRAEI